MITLDRFAAIVVADFEFEAPAGERPRPVCLVAHELRSGRRFRLWRDELERIACPYPTGPDALFVSYYASAELGCHQVLGWPRPRCVLDLYPEYRNQQNGRQTSWSSSLLGAAGAYGLETMTAAEKDRGRALVLRGGPWSPEDRGEILEYCAADVALTVQLFGRMIPRIDLPRALLRGQFMAAIAAMEHTGVPIDRPALDRLRTGWAGIKDRLISEIDRPYGVFENGVFKQDRFAAWLVRAGIPWPRLDSGALDLEDDTFKEMAKGHPRVAPLRELRHSLSQLRLSDLAVGSDNRNRTLLSPFRAKSGRCAPSTSRFIFGPSVWLRHLIRPAPGLALAYVDYSQQEFAIAAALSGDAAMAAAYQSGDCYLAFAKQAGAVPADATKQSHGAVRDLFKTVALGTQYGMKETSLAARIGRSESDARDLLRRHRETYPKFWRWSQAAIDVAMLHGSLSTVFGWRLHVGPTTTSRTFANYPMQGNGAEMLRLACVTATARGVRLCAPIHDAVLIEAPADQIDQAVITMRTAMRQASETVLNGFPLRTDVDVIRYPDRYRDPRGRRMWTTVQGILDQTEVRHVA